MDIPALKKDIPSEVPVDDSIEVNIASVTDAIPAPTPDPVTVAIADKNPVTVASKQDEANKKIAELISSKQYILPIKERRTKPLLVLSLSTRKKKKSIPSRKPTNKTVKPKGKDKKMIQLVVLVGLVIGLFLAIDIGWIDIGLKLPFSLFGN